MQFKDPRYSTVTVVNSTGLCAEKCGKWADLHCVLNTHTHIHTHTKTPYSVIPFTQKRSRTGRSPERKRRPVVTRA